MTVKELIDELLATCRNDGEQVVVQDSGLVTRVSTGKLPGTGEPAVFLNDYPREVSDDALPLCACEQYYGSHHPECPARRAYEGALLKLDEYEHRAKLHMDRCQHDMERIVALEQQNEALASRLEQCQRVIGFFASVIKSGEAWTDDCQAAFDGAIHPSRDSERE